MSKKSPDIEDTVTPYPLSGRPSFAQTYPGLAILWCYAKNCGFAPEDFSCGSGVRVWWVCQNDCTHVFKSAIGERVRAYRNRSADQGCKFCRGLAAAPSNSLIRFRHLVAEWDIEKNHISPEKVVAGSNTKWHWRCIVCTHEFIASVKERTTGQTGCPACAGKIVLPTKSLAYLHPKLAKEWHPTLNGNLRPETISEHSNRLIWWQCMRNCDHVWPATVNSRTSNNSGCPKCIGRRAAHEREHPSQKFRGA